MKTFSLSFSYKDSVPKGPSSSVCLSTRTCRSRSFNLHNNNVRSSNNASSWPHQCPNHRKNKKICCSVVLINYTKLLSQRYGLLYDCDGMAPNCQSHEPGSLHRNNGNVMFEDFVFLRLNLAQSNSTPKVAVICSRLTFWDVAKILTDS